MTLGEVISTGQVCVIYGSRCGGGGRVTVGKGSKLDYLTIKRRLSAGTKLFIDRNFNHNQQIN